MSEPKLKDFVILGEFTDGKFRKVLITDDTKTNVLQLIRLLETKIRHSDLVLNDFIDNIELTQKIKNDG